jgi:hypothetical protein
LPEPDEAGTLVFGRIQESRIMMIWNSERYRAFKQAHARCRITDYPTCDACAQSRETRQISVPGF